MYIIILGFCVILLEISFSMQVMVFYDELSHRVHSRSLQGRCMGSSPLIWILELLWETRLCVRFQVLLIGSGEHQEQTLGGSDSSCNLWGLAVVQVLVVNKAKSSKPEACWQDGSQERHRRALITVRERRVSRVCSSSWNHTGKELPWGVEEGKTDLLNIDQRVPHL